MAHVQLDYVIVIVRKSWTYRKLAGIQACELGAEDFAVWYTLEHRAQHKCNCRPGTFYIFLNTFSSNTLLSESADDALSELKENLDYTTAHSRGKTAILVLQLDGFSTNLREFRSFFLPYLENSKFNI